MFELKKATLEDLQGHGYAYTQKTVWGKARQGVIFVEDEDALQELQEADELTFTGTIYHRGREKKAEFPVTITDVTSTRAGERADFESVENGP